MAATTQRNLRMKRGSSDKFWHAALSGRRWSVTWGRSGTAGQSRTYELETKEAARADFERKVAEKLAKGYVEEKKRSSATTKGGSLPVTKERARLERRLSRAGLDEASIQGLMALARPAILLKSRKAKPADLALGATRVGGQPDLPEKFRWPRDTRFVAQIRMQDVASLDAEGLLPKDGWLVVFSDLAIERVTLRHLPEETQLVPTPAPDDAHGSIARGVTFEPELHLPPPGSELVSFASTKPVVGSAKRLGSLLALEPDMHDRYWDAWVDWRTALRPSTPYGGHHQLLGYGHMQIEQKKTERVLFAFDTDIHAKLSWGDESTVFLLIQERALQAGKLERLRATW